MPERRALPVNYMEPKGMDYSKIELGVREAVRSLNSIPFVETVSSCEGHVLKKLHGYKCDPGFLFLEEGHIGMYIDETDKRSAVFIKDISLVVGKYHFANFGKIYMKNFDGPYGIGLNSAFMGVPPFDLAEQDRAVETDPIDVIYKKARQAKASLIRERKIEYQNLWKEVEIMARKHHDKAPI